MTKQELQTQFEKWFIEKFTDMFSQYNPLEKRKNGVYKDRGTLGMWLVWQEKCYEIDLLNKQRKILLGDLCLKTDVTHFENVVQKLKMVNTDES